MGITTEEYFPRGGKKPFTLGKQKDSGFNLFAGKQKNNRKTSKRVQNQPRDQFERFTLDPTKVLTAKSAETLKYKTVQEGMVILGCIREVSHMGLTVSLPGRLSGKVPLTNISEPYTNLLRSIVQEDLAPEEYKTISKLFHVGQYVNCKIVSIARSPHNDLHQLTLSLAPHDIQYDWNHGQLMKGVVVTAAVSSIEDHGYVMDVGIANSRPFLPKHNVDCELGIGQVLWCCVTKADTNPNASTVVLTAIKTDIYSKFVDGVHTLHDVLPAMKVQFTVDKVLSDGLQGKFLNEFTGYINNAHLKSPFEDLSKYAVDQTLEARVLYIMPVSKLPYLTLKNIEETPKALYSEGHLTTAKILGRAGKGLFISLPKRAKGYVSYRRLKGPNYLGDLENLLDSYQIGTSHMCRILDYDLMDSLHICTFEKELLHQKYFSYNDLTLGEIVNVTVKKIEANGIEVNFGRLSGFIQNMHLSDISLNTNVIFKKYHVGQKLNARVLSVFLDRNYVLLTLKPSLLDSTIPCLTSYDKVARNSQYNGVIVQISAKGLLVAFYGDVRGWVPNFKIKLPPNAKIEDIYKIGQVVKCQVLKSNPSKKTMSLLLPTVTASEKPIHLGQRVNAKVTSVESTGIELELKQGGSAFLPTLQLTENPSLAPALLGLYKEGMHINNLICVGKTVDKIFLSKRESPFFSEIPVFDEVNVGTLLRCSFKNATENKIFLYSAIRNFKYLVTVPKELISDSDIPDLLNLKIETYAPVMCKVQSVDKTNHEIIATTKLSECWNKSPDASVDLLMSYLEDFHLICKRPGDFKTFMNNIKIGQTIKGVIKSVGASGCSLKCKGVFDGFIPKAHCINEPLKVGEVISGSVIWIDFPQNQVIVSTLPKYISKLKYQDGKSTSEFKENDMVKVEILFTTPDFAFGITCKQENYYKILLPTKLHYNDFSPSIHDYPIGAVIQAVVSKVDIYGFIIGVRKSLFTNKKLKSTGLKRNVENNSGESPRKRSKSSIDLTLNPKFESKAIGNVKKHKNIRAENPSEADNTPLPKKIKSEQKRPRSSKKVAPEKNITSEDSGAESSVPESIKPVLPGADVFWNLKPDMLKDNIRDESSSESESEQKSNSKKKKLTKAERLEEARKEEEKLRAEERRLADDSILPDTVDQFDRLVLAQPDSSHAWISYIAFHLQGTEIEKARSIARKALSTISFRLEQEKLNVWVALLNLENRFGTKETFNSVLEEAARVNDSRTVLLRGLQILADSEKHSDFQELLAIVLRRHKHSSETWYQSAISCYKLGLLERGRGLLQRALTCLDKKHHVDLIIQFAHLEVKHGNQERAETLFEQVLGSYAKRVDVWCSYADMLIKSNRIDIARKVLDRAVSLRLPARKMKTLFKKFIVFEESYGDAGAVEKVREMAVEYVRTATS